MDGIYTFLHQMSSPWRLVQLPPQRARAKRSNDVGKIVGKNKTSFSRIKAWVWGMPKAKKSILKGIASLRMRIKEHEMKIKEAILTNQNLHHIAHWEKEIRAFQQEILRLKSLAKR